MPAPPATYEPSPADFYQEPEAPAEPAPAEPAVAEPAAEPGAVEPAEQPGGPETPGQPLQPETAEPQTEPETPAVIEPTVKPRPQRRALRMPASRDGTPYNASGMRNVDKENINAKED